MDDYSDSLANRGGAHRPRVLVRTLPLENGNYGGLLQAFALQRTLIELGLDAVTDRATRFERRHLSLRLKDAVRVALLRSGYSKAGWLDRLARAKDAPFVAEFVERHIETVGVHDAQGAVDYELLETFDAYVVGSDQVWRRRYADPTTNLFGFLLEGDHKPRLSYAASFGRDDLDEYDDTLIAQTAELAARFSAISVREASGVRLVRDHWGLHAEQNIDPTFLLPVESYATLAATARDRLPAGHLVDYVLDEDPASRRVVDDIGAKLGLSPLSLIPQTPRSYREWRRDPQRFARSSVEAWLGAIASATFVVTDSFHGTAFAIIHNVPFVSVVNSVRGAARFESLLQLLGLQDRLIKPGSSVPATLLEDPIDWGAVNRRVREERGRAIDYLGRLLGSDADATSSLAPRD